MYDGTHYMEEEFVRSLLVETICKILKMQIIYQGTLGSAIFTLVFSGILIL